MKPEQGFESLMREARAMRAQYIGGLLRSVWNTAINNAHAIAERSLQMKVAGRRGAGHRLDKERAIPGPFRIC